MGLRWDGGAQIQHRMYHNQATPCQALCRAAVMLVVPAATRVGLHVDVLLMTCHAWTWGAPRTLDPEPRTPNPVENIACG